MKTKCKKCRIDFEFSNMNEIVICPKCNSKAGKMLRCPSCNHEWCYSGKAEFFCSCPMCKRSINVRKK